ncbi:MAG: tetratricopeptide repeat-containing protein, partial [candidate division Zixibacteria bacterium]|nr:tetratricopeptide repeat-containing protein [candidate division Zixibacteria bacterium]
MKQILTIISALLLSLLATPYVFAQGAGSEWEILDREFSSLYQQGQYDSAVVVARKALKVAEKNVSSDHPDVAKSLNNLALLYSDQGQYAQAEPLYNRSLAIFEKALGPDHPDVAQSLNNLASLYQHHGHYGQA